MKKSSRILKRKLKLVSSELRMLQAYKLDMSLLLDDYTSEFLRDMSFIKQKLKDLPNDSSQEDDDPSLESAGTSLDLDSDSTQEWRKTKDGWEKTAGSKDKDKKSEEVEGVDKPSAPAWAKKLYKKIAMVSHPDRTIEDHRKKKLNKIFRDCAQIMSDGNFDDLLGYALELDLELHDDDVNHLPIMTARIESLKKEIADVQSSVEWLWGETLGVNAMRLQIAAGVLAREGLVVNNEDLSSIISSLEGQDANTGNDS